MTNTISEEIQSGMRRRLELLRRSKQLMKSQIRSLGADAVRGYEQRDMSPARLGDMFALANEYGLTPQEFFAYLLGEQQLQNLVRNENANVNSAAIYIRQLTPQMQQAALMLLKALAEFQDLNNAGALD